MAWLAVNKEGEEVVFEDKPIREKHMMGNRMMSLFWVCYFPTSNSYYTDFGLELTHGISEKLLGHKMTWEDNPIEI